MDIHYPVEDPLNSSFTTRASLNRSVNKADSSLPKSPRKRNEVLGALATKFKLRLNCKRHAGGRPKKTLSEEESVFLEEFMNRNDITQTAPGRKDNVFIERRRGKDSLYIQKRYMLWTIRDTLDILNGSENKISAEEDTFKKKFGEEYPGVL